MYKITSDLDHSIIHGDLARAVLEAQSISRRNENKGVYISQRNALRRWTKKSVYVNGHLAAQF